MAGDGRKNRIAETVGHDVADALEVLDAAENEIRVTAARKPGFQRADQAAAVGEAGDHIVLGQIPDLPC